MRALLLDDKFFWPRRRDNVLFLLLLLCWLTKLEAGKRLHSPDAFLLLGRKSNSLWRLVINEAEFDRKALRRVRLVDVLLEAALHYGSESDVFRGSPHTDLALEFLRCTVGFGGRLENGAVDLEIGLWRCEELGWLRFFSK
jgi:hypothetical protein